MLPAVKTDYFAMTMKLEIPVPKWIKDTCHSEWKSGEFYLEKQNLFCTLKTIIE